MANFAIILLYFFIFFKNYANLKTLNFLKKLSNLKNLDFVSIYAGFNVLVPLKFGPWKIIIPDHFGSILGKIRRFP